MRTTTPDERRGLYIEGLAKLRADGKASAYLIHACCYESDRDWFVGYAFGPNHAGSLAGHVSSSERFSHHDMVTSGWKDEEYDRAYPDGYEVLWLGSCSVEEIEGMSFAGILRELLLQAQGATS